MLITPSEKQAKAIDQVMDWYCNSKEKSMVIAGYAGTGKTTIAKTIADNIASSHNGEYYPQFITFTGKAASVLRAKGCTTCTTIHSLLYTTSEQCKKRLQELRTDFQRLQHKFNNGGLPEHQFKQEEKRITSKMDAEKKNLNQPKFFVNDNSDLKTHKLVIVDEYSMLDDKIVNDLLSVCNNKVLFLGDPGQLPPVGKKAYVFKPDVFLEEIHRQALDSPILRAATQVIETGRMDLCNWVDFKCVQAKDMSWEQYKQSSQLICGKNDSAKTFNRKFRAKLGYHSPLPETGEKVMCFKNNHDLMILNGVNYLVTEDCNMGRDEELPETARLCIANEDVHYEDLAVWSRRFEYIKLEPEPEMRDKLDHFDFCYGITAHKAQGSEYDDVIIWDDYLFYNKPLDRKKWLYTSITRASKTCTLVRS